MRRLILISVFAASLTASALIATTPSDTEGAAWRIYTQEAGLHRVTFSAIADSAPSVGSLPSAELALENRGRLVPLFVADGGDGEFGPGDWFEFAAEVLSGQETYHHSHARHNVYWLHQDRAKARRLAAEPAEPAGPGEPLQARRRRHFERDQLLIRLSSADVDERVEPELWYWSKLTHLSAEPFSLTVDVRDADHLQTGSLRIGLRGLSELPRDASRPDRIADHHVSIGLAGQPLINAAWDGRRQHVASRGKFGWPETEAGGSQRIDITVKERSHEDEPLVDVVMVDWVQLDYPFNGRLIEDQVELQMPFAGRGGVLELTDVPNARWVASGRLSGYRDFRFDSEGKARINIGPGESSLWLRRTDAVLEPTTVEWDRPSSLRAFDQQADYLVIAHGSLIEATTELVELHRQRGLTVELIDVQDIYDEFGDGIVDPAAIRSFLRHAHLNWRAPRPRFALLVGDASWDSKNATVDDANYSNWVGRQLLHSDRFVAKKTEDYDPDRRNDRNLIPSWNYHTREGHAASDAYFTLIDGDDELPDIALGRFPVVTSDEVRSITEKIRRYIEAAPLGPWRSRLAWISGGLVAHQRRSTALARDFAERGLSATVILPGDKARPEDRQRITDAFDQGNLVTHFIGHGGRFIWRTGPPDLKNQVDLFGLDDVAALPQADALPVVLSVACYSAPFDHPSADSIGETFLRLPDRGAIAFIGASWRNAPPISLSKTLVDELAQPGTIGEALMRTKRQMTSRDAIHLFNLLGDPAVPVAAPRSKIEIAHQLVDGELELSAELPAEAVGGRVAVDFVDAKGTVLDSLEVASNGRELSVKHFVAAEVRAATVYFWNDDTRHDGMGVAVLDRGAEEPAAATAPTRP